MFGLSPSHLILLALLLVLLLGSGRISGVMGDFAKGIKSFKKHMAEPDDASMEAGAEKPAGTLPGAQASHTARETTTTTR